MSGLGRQVIVFGAMLTLPRHGRGYAAMPPLQKLSAISFGEENGGPRPTLQEEDAKYIFILRIV